MRILFFGDSITQGFWDSKGGWVARLIEHYTHAALQDLHANKYQSLFNLGVSGNTSRDLLVRIENEVKARLWRNEKVGIVIAIGTNDSLFQGSDQWVKLDEFRENLKNITATIEPFAEFIVLVGNIACDEKLTTPVSWGDSTYTNNELYRYERAAAKIADQQNYRYVPLHTEFKARLAAGEALLADGLHPNDAGHALIAQKVQVVLDKIL